MIFVKVTKWHLIRDILKVKVDFLFEILPLVTFRIFVGQKSFLDLRFYYFWTIPWSLKKTKVVNKLDDIYCDKIAQYKSVSILIIVINRCDQNKYENGNNNVIGHEILFSSLMLLLRAARR